MKFIVSKNNGYAFFLWRKNKTGRVKSNLKIENLSFQELLVMKYEIEKIVEKEYNKLLKK
jgi:hypothetical protein